MRCLELSTNGVKVARAGISQPGIVELKVVLHHEASASNPTPDATVRLHATEGLEGNAYEWPAQVLQTGERMELRVVECDAADAPSRTTPAQESLLRGIRDMAGNYLAGLAKMVLATMSLDDRFARDSDGGTLEQLESAASLDQTVPLDLRLGILEWTLKTLLRSGAIEAAGEGLYRLGTKRRGSAAVQHDDED